MSEYNNTAAQSTAEADADAAWAAESAEYNKRQQRKSKPSEATAESGKTSGTTSFEQPESAGAAQDSAYLKKPSAYHAWRRQLIDESLFDAQLKSEARILGIAIAWDTNDGTRLAWPGLDTYRERLGFKWRDTVAAAAALQRRGRLKSEKRGTRDHLAPKTTNDTIIHSTRGGVAFYKVREARQKLILKSKLGATEMLIAISVDAITDPKTGEYSGGLQFLADQLGIRTRKTVQRAMRKLTTSGWFEVRDIPGRECPFPLSYV
jgi:hypothetical protein